MSLLNQIRKRWRRGRLGSRDYRKVRRDVEDALQRGDVLSAWRLWQPIVGHPATELSDKYLWNDAFVLLAEIAFYVLQDEEAARQIAFVAQNREHVAALRTVATEMTERNAPAVGATLLAQALRLAPQDDELRLQFCDVLFRCRKYSGAAALLRGTPLLERDLRAHYLFALNQMMIGRLERVEAILLKSRELASHQSDDEARIVVEFLEGLVERGRVVEDRTPLDERDLRGWHWVLNGAVLLHLSMVGREEMNGRYAWIQDSYSLCRSGLESIGALMQQWGMQIPRVFGTADRGSSMLGHAAAQYFGVPFVEWSSESVDSPGLIVVYDLDEIDPALLESLSVHRPGQILWSHASSWFNPLPFAPDVTTFLYEVVEPPWRTRAVDPGDPSGPLQIVEDEGSPVDLAQKILVAEPHEPPDEITRLLDFASAIGGLSGHHGAGALRKEEKRRPYFADSPVHSNSFQTLL